MTTGAGLPVANATVSAYTLAGVWVVDGYTNASGNYTMALPAGSYKLRVYGAGIPTQWVGGTTFATATVTVLTTSATQNIVLTTTLSGTVTTGAGLPVANATVSAYTLAGVWVVDGYTNASGNYTMALPAGSYKLRVYGSGIPTQWVGGTTFATATVTVLTTSATQNIVLQP